jgi:hypothetical protein
MFSFHAVRAARIIAFHDACLARADWPADAESARSLLPTGPLAEAANWALVNHKSNCLLWKEEDLARRKRVADAEIAANKRNIDRFNQARNDAVERIDEALQRVIPNWPPAPEARLSSETPGAMIDRLSILSLKIFNTRLQAARADVDDNHRETARANEAQLCQQRKDLADCLDRLWDEILNGIGHFKVYRQCKMYNKADWNPELVSEGRLGTAGG